MNLKNINKILFIFAIILFLTFIIPKISQTTGKSYSIEALEPSCSYQETPLPPSLCCRELQKQLKCEKTNSQLSCSVINKHHYIINLDQYNFCLELGYEMPKIK